MEFLKLKKIHSRELSDFAANHLLFEYARNTLDQERKISVEKAMENSPDLQSDFIKLINGIQYCERLSETLVNDTAINQIEQQSSQVNFVVNRLRWHQWPLGFKWLLEAGVVAFLLVLVLNVLPLNRIIHLGEGTNTQTIIAEVDRKKKINLSELPEANKQNPDFDDEEVKKGTGSKLAQVEDKSSTTNPAVIKSISETKPSIKPTATIPTIAPTTSPVLGTSAESTVQAKTGGWIYRGQFLITNAIMATPKIQEKIREMGGQKAGEVEIGWQKAPNLFYFHFTIPEAKLQELQVLLKEFSNGKMVKEAHPRVMPDGIVRLLFTIEENAASDK